MKKILKLLCIMTTILTTCIILCLSAFADHSYEYYEYMSSATGLSIDELRIIEKHYGDLREYCNITVPNDVKIESEDEVCFFNRNETSVNRSSSINTYASSSGSGSSSPMSSSDWQYMLGWVEKGDIIVTKDYYALGVYNSGHAGIMYNGSDTSDGTFEVVEHTGTGTSKCYNLQDHWRRLYTMRAYYVDYSNITNQQRKNAADYAYEHLQGLSYNGTAKVTDQAVNCASLVWKAFKYTYPYVELDKSSTGLCVPSNFVQTNKTVLWASVNWNTGDHVW